MRDVIGENYMNIELLTYYVILKIMWMVDVFCCVNYFVRFMNYQLVIEMCTIQFN